MSDLPAVIRMGNDLARNLGWRGCEAGAEAVAAHITKFWDPRMRAELAQYATSSDPRLDPLLATAAETLGGVDAR